MKAAFLYVKRLFAPKMPACAGPEKGASAATALSTVSWWDPPTATPTQLSSVRTPSLRTTGGMFFVFGFDDVLGQFASHAGSERRRCGPARIFTTTGSLGCRQ